MGKIIRVIGRQTGQTKSKSKDKKRCAMPPSVRIGKTGRIYRETRKNRSDMLNEMPKSCRDKYYNVLLSEKQIRKQKARKIKRKARKLKKRKTHSTQCKLI